MIEFTDEELNQLTTELDERADHYRHYPDECDDYTAFVSIRLKVYDEAKKRGFRWAQH